MSDVIGCTDCGKPAMVHEGDVPLCYSCFADEVEEALADAGLGDYSVVYNGGSDEILNLALTSS